MPKAANTPPMKKKSFVFTGQYEKILTEAINRHYFLTARQITRLLYPTEKLGNYTTVSTRLKQLTMEKYLQSEYVPIPERQRPYYYYLGREGKKFLEAAGQEIVIYYEPHQQAKYWQLMHCLELNDFLITARLIDKAVPSLELASFLHDYQIKRNPPKAMKYNGTVVQPIPDAFLDIRYTFTQSGEEKRRRYCYVVEYDRASESETMLRKKVRDYLACLNTGSLPEHFGCQKLTILFVTSAGWGRVEKLRSYVRREVKNAGDTTLQMFAFTSVPPLMREPLDPKSLFCSPRWLSVSGGAQQHSLIDLQ